MNKLLPALSLLLAPLATFSQAELVINGTSPVTIVEHGGTAAKPIYLEINNGLTTAIKVTGTNGWIVSESEFNMVKWDISANTGAYLVPFGYNNLYYIPLTTTISVAGSAGGSIKFSTYHTLALNSALMPSDVNNMGPIYPSISSPNPANDSYDVVDRFWIIDTYLTGPNTYATKPTLSNILFSYLSSGAGANSEVAGPNVAGMEPLLLAQRFHPGGKGWGDWEGGGGLDVPGGNTGNDQVGAAGVSPANFFRSWTLANQNSPLPIDISSFTDVCNSGSALIQWTSQSELNNDYYTVTKTMDNVHFETVGTVKGAGTTSMPSNYQITDNSPFAGTSYYYLSQTDFDNTTTFIKSIPFTGCGSSSTTVTTVNAFNTTNFIQVEINSVAADNFDISLVNMLGQTVLSENRLVAIGNNNIELNNLLSPGVYILNVKNDKLNYTKKLIIGVR